MRLISELKRRNVFRMAMLYAAAAWAVLEGVDVLSGLIDLPGEFGRALLIVLAIGFPIALVASWFLELTPEGLALDKDTPETASGTPFGGRRMDFVIIAVLSAALLMFAYDKWWPRGPMELSIAVMPLQNMSPDPEQDYFADGLSEEILNRLAHIWPLKVIARTSSFSFKNKDVDIATIAAQLEVRYILEGSVRTDGDRVRITAQLIDTEDSTHLWSQTYDRDLSATNLFYIQSEVARAVTDKLRVTLTGEDETRLARVPTENTEAYAAYLIGRERLRDRQVQGLEDAVNQFARAIELDEEFAGAYSGLADACFLYHGYSGGRAHEHCPQGSDGLDIDYLVGLARRAVELDPELGEAWISLGNALDKLNVRHLTQSEIGVGNRQALLAEAKTAYERGLELNPSYSTGHHWYAMRLFRTRWYVAEEEWWDAWRNDVWWKVIEQGLEVDPLAIQLHYLTAYPWYVKDREKSLWHARRIIEIAPDSWRGYERLGEYLWELNGRADEMVRLLNRAAELEPEYAWHPAQKGYAYHALGDYDMALAYFERARGLRAQDARFVARMGLAKAMVLLDLGRSDEASMILEALLESGEDWPRVVLAGLDLASGNPDRALARYRRGQSDCFDTARILNEEDGWNCDLLGFARVLQVLGEHERAEKLGHRAFQQTKLFRENLAVLDYQTDVFFIVRIYAMAGKQDEALAMLEKQVQLGYRGFRPGGSRLQADKEWRFFAYHDIRLDSIRDHPRFRAAIAVIEADMAQQLENVREMERKGELPTLEEVRAGLSRN